MLLVINHTHFKILTIIVKTWWKMDNSWQVSVLQYLTNMLLYSNRLANVKCISIYSNRLANIKCVAIYSNRLANTCSLLLPDAGAAVPVLPVPNWHRHVPPQQQLPLPQLPPKPATRVLRPWAQRLSVHWWPTAVPLHQGMDIYHLKAEHISHFKKVWTVYFVIYKLIWQNYMNFLSLVSEFSLLNTSQK